MRPALRQACEAGKPAALVTLIRAEGGSPRPVGTQMVFAEGLVAGHLSGGCVEGDVALHAEACLADGQPRRLVYGEGSPWPDIRLLCGAGIELLVERVGPEDRALAELLAAFEARRPVAWITDGLRREVHPLDHQRPWAVAVMRPYEPAFRLVVTGGDPTALAIASLGAQAGFETTLVRPNGPLEPPPLPGVAYRREAADAALAAIGLDRWTAVAAATHDMDHDQAALGAALPSEAFYVGLLGARSRLPERLDRLRASGVSEAALARLHAPIGLDLGGKAPWEVAVAVIAEVMIARYERGSASTSTGSPAAAAGAPAGRRSSASAAAKTLTSEES
jgi:xanthine dehydrogenase accessory factor